MRNFAMMFLVLDMSNNSGVHYSITLFCEYGTILLFGFFVGVMADRWDKKRTLSMAILSRAVVMTIFMLGVYYQTLWLVYLAATLSALGTVFFRASQSAFTMQFVPPEDRATAASLRQMSMSVLLLIGPMIGTFIYVQAGASLTLLGTVLLFVLAGGLIWSIRIEAQPGEQQEPPKSERAGSSMLQELVEGLRYLWNNRYVRPILYSNAMFGVVAGVMNVMDIFVITEFFNLPREAIAIALPWQAAAMFVGSFVVKRFKLSHELLMSFALVLLGGGLFGAMLTNNIYLAMAFLILNSFGLVAYNVATATMLQLFVDFKFQGRVNTTTQSAWLAVMVVTMVASGWLHEFVSARMILLTGGAVVLAGAAFMFLTMQRQNKARAELD